MIRRPPRSTLFPTRRSSDLSPLPPLWSLGYQQCRYSYYPESRAREIVRTFREKKIPADTIYFDIDRSEEHTSELQSRLHLVCRLLLEKKKIHTQDRVVNSST